MIKKTALLTTLICAFLVAHVLVAQETLPKKKVIRAIVNVLGDTEISDEDLFDAMKEAQRILAEANIHLSWTRNPHPFPFDDEVDRTEFEDLVKKSKEELDKHLEPDGSGIKINIATDCWTTSDSLGWAWHGVRATCVEVGDPNRMGGTIAHEIGHILTIDGHSSDPNDVMHAFSPHGDNWSPTDVNEIHKGAKKLNSGEHLVDPVKLPGWSQSIAVPAGIIHSIDARGFRLDPSHDQTINDPHGVITGPDDPTIKYSDIDEIVMFCDEPFDPAGKTTLEIKLAGHRPPDVPVDLFFDAIITDCSGVVGRVWINVPASGAPTAAWENFADPSVQLPEPIVTRHYLLDGDDLEDFYESVEAAIPTELISSQLLSADPLVITVSCGASDSRVPGPPFIETSDYAEPFEFGLTQPAAGPHMLFGPRSIFASGFAGEVGIELDGRLIGTATAKQDGTLMYFMDPMLELQPGVHSVLLEELANNEPAGPAFTMGYFTYSPEIETIGEE